MARITISIQFNSRNNVLNSQWLGLLSSSNHLDNVKAHCRDYISTLPASIFLPIVLFVSINFTVYLMYSMLTSFFLEWQVPSHHPVLSSLEMPSGIGSVCILQSLGYLQTKSSKPTSCQHEPKTFPYTITHSLRMKSVFRLSLKVPRVWIFPLLSKYKSFLILKSNPSL